MKNRVDEQIEIVVKDFAIAFPAYGQLRASNELRKEGIFVSPSNVRFKIIADKYRNRRKRFGLRFNLIVVIYNLELIGK